MAKSRVKRKVKKTRVNTGRKRGPVTELRLAKDLIKELRAEEVYDAKLRNRMASILELTANALHGGPLEDGYWSWHDLPDRARELRKEAYADFPRCVMVRQHRIERKRLRAKIRTLNGVISALLDRVYENLFDTITDIDPFDTPFTSMLPKVNAKNTYHQWVLDQLTPVEKHTGWWWRVPYGKLLATKKWLGQLIWRQYEHR